MTSKTLAWALAGKRFGVFGFGAQEEIDIQKVVESTGAFCQILAPDEDWSASFDAVIIKIDAGETRNRLRERATPQKPPLLVIGSPQTMAGAMPLLEKTQCEFVLNDEWSEKDLILRILRLTWRMRRPEEATTPRKRPKVLILDDDSSILSLLDVVLTKAGFDCHLARNGDTGFDMAIEVKPDVMIIDVNMPHRNGFEVLRMLSQSPETATIRTVMLTACREEADILRGFGLGAKDYLTKPFNPDEVTAVVKSLLG